MVNWLRRQTYRVGGLNTVKSGTPPRIGDLYYWLMEMGWPAFVALVTLVFVLLNLAFAAVYAAMPGALLNAQPGSLADAFFFSVETLGTVGYGNMAPATRGAHTVAATEILVGLFFSATITGLIFARFARPRNSLVFSKVAVIATYNRQPVLMLRLASTRRRPLAGVTAQLGYLERVDLPTGKTVRRLTDLPLIRSTNPVMGLSWTLTHIIAADSGLLDAIHGTDRFTLSVVVNGLDTLLAAQSFGSHNYDRDDILFDHEFVDVISEIEGGIHLDMSKLHDVTEVSPT